MKYSTSSTGIRLAAAALGATLAIGALTACSPFSSSSDDKILAQLNSMQQDIDALKQQDSNSNANGNGTSSGSDAGTNSGNNSGSTGTDAASLSTSIDDLSNRTKEAVNTALATTVPQSITDRINGYVTAKAPLDALDREQDLLEDRVEQASRAGTIDRDTFWKLDQELSNIEHTIDQAENQLELRFNVDD